MTVPKDGYVVSAMGAVIYVGDSITLENPKH
jgi:hypothetical protein